MHVAVAVLMAWRVMLYCLTLEFFFRTALDASTTYVKDTAYPLLGAAVKGSASARDYNDPAKSYMRYSEQSQLQNQE